jgi:hypothetical protein
MYRSSCLSFSFQCEYNTERKPSLELFNSFYLQDTSEKEVFQYNFSFSRWNRLKEEVYCTI